MTPTAMPEQLYKGADTCDFRPEWGFTDRTAVALADNAFDADAEDTLPWLVLADRMADIGYYSEPLLREAVVLWEQARTLKPHRQTWNHDQCLQALQKQTATVEGWRRACLWGCLVAWHSPSGYDGVPMGRTWVDARVNAAWRGVWCWCLGLTSQAYAAGKQAYAAWSQADAAGKQAYAAGSQAYAAGSQAYAAGRQAYAAWRQADAAWRQAYAAGSQAYAAWRQADAAWRQADAAGRQADAAWSQADAAGRQAYAAWRQADAAWRQADAWRYARACFDLVFHKRIKR